MTENINDISAKEVVLFEGRQNKESSKYDTFSFKLFLTIIFSVISFFFISFFCAILNGGFILMLLGPIPLGFFIASFIVKKLSKGNNDKVKITNKGIYYHEVGTNKLIKIPFSKIRNFSCQQGLMDKKVHCADIKINTDTNQYYINNINEYRDFCRIISENAHNLEPEIIIGEEIRKKVTSDEKILWEGKENSTFGYVFLAIISIFCFVGSLTLLFITPKENLFDIIKVVFVGVFLALFFTFLIYFGIKNDKKTYYIVTNERILYCDPYTDNTCKVIPLETIEQCLYIHSTKHNPAYIQIVTQENRYKLYCIGGKKKLVSLIKSAVVSRKRTLKKQEDSV